MSLQVYNTLTREMELFEPVVPGEVGIYLCGPTVYRPSHIGHAVGPVIFDTIKRYLSHKGFKVKFVINITDVEDKIIHEAAERGIGVSDLAEQITANYLECLRTLGVHSVDAFPRASQHIGGIIDLVVRLIERGAAYVAEGDVYFDHTKAADYGKLSGRRTEESLSGTRELASRSRHPSDFALWKASKPGEPAWDSPWGKGRPGWHIECSVMSMALLGETFDIHGGGMELIFPHHENEIAQSEAATGKPFARYWLHNGLTRSRTKAAGGDWQQEKMSKSLGNVRNISDLLKRYSGETIRFFILSTHYRRPLDFSDEQVESAEKALTSFHRLFERIERLTGQDVYQPGETVSRLHELAEKADDQAFVREVLQQRIQFYEVMDDDFNTAEAMATLHNLAGAINRYIDAQGLESAPADTPRKLVAGAGRSLIESGRILGLFESAPKRAEGAGLEGQLMDLLIRLRALARKEKNFAMADGIRDGLKALGVTLEDTPGGTIWRKG